MPTENYTPDFWERVHVVLAAQEAKERAELPAPAAAGRPGGKN